MDSNKKEYYENTFGQEDPLLSKIYKTAELEGIEYMQLSRADAHILQYLTQISRVKKAVEIGGLYGYSALHIARGLEPEGLLFSLDMDQQRQNISQKLLQDTSEFSKIKWICGDAHQTLSSLNSEGPFDLVFIDADKAGYLDYLNWAEKHLRVGGIVVADNAFLFDTLYTLEPELSQLRKLHSVSPQAEQVLKDFNKRITSSPHWKGAMIPTEDGMSVAVKIAEPKNES